MQAANLSADADQFKVGEFSVDASNNSLSLDGRTFRLEPKVMEVLRALARRQGETLTRGDLIDAVWRVEFGGDESLTRAVSILRKTFSAAPGGGDYIETAPKRGYRLTAPVSAAPLERDNEAVAGPAIEPARAARLPIGLAWLGALLLFGAAALYLLRRPAVETPVATGDLVAVPALAVIGGDAGSALEEEAARLRDGLVRELTRAGFAISASETAPFALTIEGNIVATAEKPSGTVHVVHSAQGGRRIWSYGFDPLSLRSRAPSAAVPQLVADALACARAANAPDGKPLSESDPVLLGLYMRGCDEWRTLGIAAKIETGQRAYAHAPDSVAAKIYYATGAAFGSLRAESPGERDSLAALAEDLADAAARQNPDIVRGELAKGVAAISAMKWERAEDLVRKALAGEPNIRYGLHSLSAILRRVGRMKEAIDLKGRAVAADPYGVSARSELALILAEAGHMKEAHGAIDPLSDVYPEQSCAMRFQIDHWRGDARKALDRLEIGDCEAASLKSGEIACAAAYLKARLGEETPERALELCLAEPVFDPVRYAAALGFVDKAYEIALTREIEWSDTPFLFYLEMAAFRRDPRFMQVAARYGLVDYWLATDQWPDFCADPELPYDCRELAQNVAS